MYCDAFYFLFSFIILAYLFCILTRSNRLGGRSGILVWSVPVKADEISQGNILDSSYMRGRRGVGNTHDVGNRCPVDLRTPDHGLV